MHALPPVAVTAAIATLAGLSPSFKDVD